MLVVEIGVENIFFCFLIASILFPMNKSKKTPHLKSAIHLVYFKEQTNQLLDPSNLNDVQEYYLLENLAAGLVYENWRDLDLWDQRLAKSWTKISDNEWRFRLSENNKWSDGSAITGEQIAGHFNYIKKRPSRHITLIKTMDSIKYDNNSNEIVFKCSKPIHEGLLHELSLSDSLILHEKNRYGDWSITSGPYFVESQNHKKVLLSYNKFFSQPLSIKNIEIIRGLKETSIDIRKRPNYSISEDVQDLISRFDIELKGNATDIFYFHFNPNNPFINDRNLRRSFSKFIRMTFENFEYADMISHNQFIPNGYSGSLEKIPSYSDVDLSYLKGKNLVILLPYYMTTVIPDLLKTESRKVSSEIDVVIESKKYETNPFVSYACFFGNQRDPLSSWKFLYGEKGPLHHFYPEVKLLFEEITHATSSKRKELLQKLHRITLEEAYAIPFIAERDAILASNRVDLSEINVFDMRLRFFEMKWK